MCTFRTVNLLAPLLLLLLHMACISSARENFAKKKTRVFCFRTSKKQLANPHTPEQSIPFFFFVEIEGFDLRRTQEQVPFSLFSHTHSLTHSLAARSFFFSLFFSLSLLLSLLLSLPSSLSSPLSLLSLSLSRTPHRRCCFYSCSSADSCSGSCFAPYVSLDSFFFFWRHRASICGGIVRLLLLSLRFSRLLFFFAARVPPLASCMRLNTRCFAPSLFDCMCVCLYALCAVCALYIHIHTRTRSQDKRDADKKIPCHNGAFIELEDWGLNRALREP